MALHRLRQLWASGGTAFGAWVMLREPLVAEVASRAGYDWVCIDLQHGVVGFDDLAGMLQAVSLGGAAPLVRVPWNEDWMIGRALDAGAVGVIVPMVNSPEEAAAAVAACRYAPRGRRSVGPLAAAVRFGDDYARGPADDVLCIVMIETASAVERADEILSVPGVDAVYVGPADLSLTLGLAPDKDQVDPRFHDALAAVVDACRRHGVVPGVHASSSLAGARHRTGFRFMATGFDLGPVEAALVADLDASRRVAESPEA